MTWLILMLAVAAAMVLFREALGRELVRVVETAPWRRLAVLAVVLFLAWISLQTFHVGVMAPLSGDSLTIVFDYAFAYADLLVALAIAVLNRQARQLVGRLIDFARFAAHRTMRRAGRARRTPARPRRRTPDRDEPEPDPFGAVLAFT